MADEDENEQQMVRRSARIRNQTPRNYSEIGNRTPKLLTAQQTRRPLIARNNQAPEVQISSNQAPAANQIETPSVQASNATSSQNVPTTSTNQTEAPSIRIYSGLVARLNDIQAYDSDSSETSSSDSSLQNSPIVLRTMPSISNTMPSTSNVEPWTAIGLSREEYEQAIQAERQWEQVRNDENFARNIQLENVEPANNEVVVPRAIQPEPVSFQPALNLLLPVPAPTEEPQQSNSAESSRVEEEPPQCVICFDDEIKSPTSCVHCKQVIGCFKCANDWFHKTKRSNTGQVPTCPLCRHIWSTQSYKRVGGPAPNSSKKRAKAARKKATTKCTRA